MLRTIAGLETLDSGAIHRDDIDATAIPARDRGLAMVFVTTFIYVTDDQLEALSMATQLVVLDAGHIAQVATPQEVYARPADTFVARFVGSPPMNLHDVDIHPHGGSARVESADLGGALDLSGMPPRITLG